MIFRTLRWRMVAAFGIVILITLLLSGGLSLWAMTMRFDVLVTDEGMAQAESIAPLLEASYALNGDWSGLNELMSNSSADMQLADSGVDWFTVAADVMGLSEDEMFDAWDEFGSLEAVARANAIPPEEVIEAIIAAETAVFLDDMSEEEGALLETAVSNFITDDTLIEDEGIDWDQIIADEMGVSLYQFYADWEYESIVEQAEQHDVSPEELIAAIMQEEQIYVENNMAAMSDNESAFYLASSLSFVEDYIYEDESYLIDMADPSVFGLITDNLFGDSRTLIVDTDDIVVYDSEGELVDEVLGDETLQQATPLWNMAQTEPIGSLIVAVGSGYYNAQQSAFLEGVALSMAISSVLAGLFALAAGWLVARRIAAPVTALTVASERLANGRLQARLPITSADELGQMSVAFNMMADELDSQQALRKRLVDDISHELHTQLSVIQLELEAMRDGMQSPEQATAQTLQEIGLLRQLVDDLSLLTAEEGMMTLDLHPVDIAELTANAVARWQPQANAAGVTLTLMASPALPSVQADSTRLVQALGNVLSNGIRYGGENLTISCAVVEDEGVWVETAVSDNGIGIPADALPYIFDRFYRVDTARGRDGRGLGLAIAHEIIELHGGTIGVKSVMGEGSVFWYRLPA